MALFAVERQKITKLLQQFDIMRIITHISTLFGVHATVFYYLSALFEEACCN